MAVKASENFKVYENPKGPKISTVSRNVIQKGKLYFKDIDGTGKVSKVNDWRLPAAERAAAYVKELTLEEVCTLEKIEITTEEAEKKPAKSTKKTARIIKAKG